MQSFRYPHFTMAQSLTKSASELSDIVYEVVFKKTESESFGVTSVETLLQDLRYANLKLP